jgi:glycerate 2-kinase
MALESVDARRHVDVVLAAVRRAADPLEATARALREGADPGPWAVLALGKAAGAMAAAALDVLGDGVGRALTVTSDGATAAPVGQTVWGEHPLPGPRSVAAGERVKEFVREAAARGGGERLLVLLSGGASALATLPVPGLSLADLRAVTDGLLRAGAPIGDVNAVRKHVDLLKGGRLAAMARPKVVWTLVLSDVLGDRVDAIGSGPTVPDPTTFADALAVLERYGLRGAVPAVAAELETGVRGERAETPKPGDPAFRGDVCSVVGSNAVAVEAAEAEAARLGFDVVGCEQGVEGEAARVGRALAGRAAELRGRAPACWVLGGETTVTVGAAAGRGGRNQELALAAALALDGVPGVAVASFATDGVDGPTDAAGAVVTGETCAAARSLGLDPAQYVRDHDSYTLLDSLGCLIRTGPTGTNVNDLAVLFVY